LAFIRTFQKKIQINARDIKSGQKTKGHYGVVFHEHFENSN